MWKMIGNTYRKYQEAIDYLFWGVCTTVVSWGTYALFVKAAGLSVGVGNVISWVCAASFAYVTNKLFVFKSRSWDMKLVLREVSSFMGSRVVTGVGEIVSVPLLVSIGLNQAIFGVKGFLAKVLVSVLVVIANYVLSKLFVFRQKK
ncbi:MAG: GtrA family protein [Lachnospiraceae bacterium]|nr:GtrA family protein [Lachnospiraceae bacterium]